MKTTDQSFPSSGQCHARYLGHAWTSAGLASAKCTATWAEPTPAPYDAAPVGTHPTGGGFS